jgi:hypothetical protein
MAAIGTREENPNLRGAILSTPPGDQRCGVLIVGSRRANSFVATDVLISADTLSDEEAIRAWLAQHAIHVTPRCSDTASTQTNSTEAIGQ